MSKYIDFDISKSFNQSLASKLNKESIKTINKLSEEELFQVNFRGTKFHCLPFLVNGASYIGEIYKNALCRYVAHHEFTNKVFGYDDLCIKPELLDFGLVSCLLPTHSDYGFRELACVVVLDNPKAYACELFKSAIQELNKLLESAYFPQLTFKVTDICNTQAFSYYMIFKWLFKINPLLSKILGDDYKRLNLDKLLDSFCPVDCSHDKYLKGEITLKQLKDKYLSYINHKYMPDGDMVREIMCVCTEGEYNGSAITPNELDLVNDIIFFIRDTNFKKLNYLIGFCKNVHDGYLSLAKAYEDSKKTIKHYESCYSKLNSSFAEAKNSLLVANNRIKDLQQDVMILKSSLAKCDSEKLLAEIDKLKKELSDYKSEVAYVFSENLTLKRKVSLQKKQLRKLDSICPSSVSEKDEISDDFVNIDSINLEDAIAFIKGKSIGIVGGNLLKDFEKRLIDYGVSSVRYIDTQTKTLGNIDIVVVITGKCHHSDLYRCEKLLVNKDIDIVYFNSTNVEKLIKAVYSDLKEV